mmetsp:Transcript_6795/g.9462  ORF Transcript_6795/g.9462 Transcript_6795/m.9462 type:complete len:217 (-) Transcript_6795:804-1454(-)
MMRQKAAQHLGIPLVRQAAKNNEPWEHQEELSILVFEHSLELGRRSGTGKERSHGAQRLQHSLVQEKTLAKLPGLLPAAQRLDEQGVASKLRVHLHDKVGDGGQVAANLRKGRQHLGGQKTAHCSLRARAPVSKKQRRSSHKDLLRHVISAVAMQVRARVHLGHLLAKSREDSSCLLGLVPNCPRHSNRFASELEGTHGAMIRCWSSSCRGQLLSC